MRVPCVRAVVLLLVGTLVLACLAPALAQPAAPALVTVEVIKNQKGLTNSPTVDLYEFTLRVTNKSSAAVQFTNNSFILVDSAGTRHRVARPWYRQTLALQPGETATVDRLYFEIPKDTDPKTVALVRGRQVLGNADL